VSMNRIAMRRRVVGRRGSGLVKGGAWIAAAFAILSGSADSRSGAPRAQEGGRSAAPPAERNAATQDSVDRDYAGELPRIPPMDVERAKGAFRVAPGYRIELAASEPLVVDPVAVAFDENGRMFVVEMRDYSEDDALRLGRIRLLDDTDDDGRFDHATIYAEGLAWPTAICCFEGGVFVGAAPDIHYFKDTDGDGKADQSRIVFTGFGKSNVQGLLNSFHWGLDNRIHGATSSSGADVTRPDTPQSPPVVLRGRDFAFDPRTFAIEPTSGGAQHGMSFDAWGNKFVCSNSDHMQMVMYEDRYAARNPYAAAPPPRVSIAVDGPQADVFRTSPVEPWRVLRTRLRMKQVVPGVVEGGGRAAGYFTGATGATIYTGDAWPLDAQGLAIVGDVGSNLVHRKRLTPKGVGMTATRVDSKSEFVTSDDIWFRPVQFANAPDGTLFILDMYREVIEHPASLHPVIKKHLDLTSGRDRGRIWRVVPDAFARRPNPRLDRLDARELTALLDHANGWHRTTAARLLVERRDTSAARELELVAAGGERPEGRIAALYALDGLGRLTAESNVKAMGDAHPRVRAHAARLSESRLGDSPELRAGLAALADDPEQIVRYQAAFSLGAMSGPRRDAALARIAERDAEEPYVRFAIQSAVESGAAEVLARLVGDGTAEPPDGTRMLIQALSAQIGRQQRPEDVATLLRLVPRLGDRPAASSIVAALALPADSPLAAQLAAATGGKSTELLAAMIDEAVRIAGDAREPADRRAASVARLRLAPFASQGDLFGALLAPSEPANVRLAAVQTLSTYADPAVAGLLIDAWPTLGPTLRQRVGDMLLSRSEWTSAWVSAVEDGRIPPGDIAPGHWQSLTALGDAELRDRAAQLVRNARGNRREIVRRYQESLRLDGDAPRGRQVFQKICAACHRVEGAGHAIGPSLAAARDRGAESILMNVLAPNAEVNPQYINYVVVTKDGRTLTGIIVEETASGVTLVRADDARDAIARIDIESMRSTGLSLMPEGVERDIDPQGMADLLAYIRSSE